MLKWIIENLNATAIQKNAADIANLMAMVKELEAKSLHEENRVNEMNINMSMQHQTMVALCEDHKELIDQH